MTEVLERLCELSIVMPAYEEAANLDVLLPQLKQVAASLTQSFEIIVVDTETPRDDTPQICNKYSVRYISRTGGNLFGHAIKTGIVKSKGKHVVFMDADGSHNPNFIPLLWQERDTADLTIASRYVSGGKTENPAILIFLSLIVNVVFRLVLNLRCMDVSNSFRLYRGDDLRALRLRCNHFDIVEEILVVLTVLHPGYRIKELPFTFETRKAGKTKRKLIAFAFGYLAVLIRLYKLKRTARRQLRESKESKSGQ